MERFLTGKRSVRAVASLGAMLVVGGGVAFATIPDSSGVIHGCYSKKSGELRVIDTEDSDTCRKAERELAWNQEGPSGPQGPDGPPGPPGVSAAFATPTGGPIDVVAPFVTLAELRVPSGSYVINASMHLENADPDHAIAVCAIGGWADSGVGVLELGGQDGAGNSASVGTLSFVFADTFPAAFTLRLNCRDNAAAVGGLSAHNIHLVATQVGTLYGARWTPPPPG